MELADVGDGMDPNVVLDANGEVEWITATVEIPIEDGELTETQTLRAVFALVKILEYYHPVLVNVMESGEIDFSIVEQTGFIMSLMNQLMDIDGMEEDSDELDSIDDEQKDEDSESSSDDFGDFIESS